MMMMMLVEHSRKKQECRRFIESLSLYRFALQKTVTSNGSINLIRTLIYTGRQKHEHVKIEDNIATTSTVGIREQKRPTEWNRKQRIFSLYLLRSSLPFILPFAQYISAWKGGNESAQGKRYIKESCSNMHRYHQYHRHHQKDSGKMAGSLLQLFTSSSWYTKEET